MQPSHSSDFLVFTGNANPALAAEIASHLHISLGAADVGRFSDGEVTVENSVAAAHDSMVVSILGPGSLIGDMGIIDGGPRSATCTASTDLALAVLTREALTRLMDTHPSVAARLLLAMSKRIADHLRETNRKLMTFAQVSKALQQELDAAHGVNKRLLDQLAAQAGKPTPAG